MVEVCDICGGVGNANAILICPKCKTSREHGYCRKFHSNRTDDWSCDECDGKMTCSSKELGKELASSSSGCKYDKPAHSSLADKYMRVKMATKGKVKAIAPPEAIMLSSCSKRFNVPVKTIKLENESSTKIAEPMCTTSSSRKMKLPCKRQINYVVQRQDSRISQVPKGHEINGGPFPLINDIEKCKPTDAERKDERYTHVPACHSSWKGQIEIQGENFNYNSSGVVALPRARSLRCVFECSQRMPALLQFKLTPRKDIWRSFFPDDCPSEGDIGLYFYSGENKRATDYDFLVKFIEDQDFVMRCDIGEAELCLFTSKLLPAGYQRFHNDYFLWGFFRMIKKHIQ